MSTKACKDIARTLASDGQEDDAAGLLDIGLHQGLDQLNIIGVPGAANTSNET